MGKNEVKSRSVKKKAPMRDLSNIKDFRNGNNGGGGGGGGGGKFLKSAITKKKLISEEDEMEKEQNCTARVQGREEEDDGSLDRLLLLQSNISSLTHQIDELVAQAFKIKATSKDGRNEIESFTSFLSEMLSSLKPWVPRFEKVLSFPAMESEPVSRSLDDSTVCTVNENDENLDVESPEQTQLNCLISPSPLVSWRAGCNVERGRQLFLLTPLPMSKTLSFKRHDLSKSVFDRVGSSSAIELQSVLAIHGDVNDDLLEGVTVEATPIRPSHPVTNETKPTLGCGLVSSPACSKRDNSMLIMTPCSKMSPPRSCVLLEPISEISHKGNYKGRKSTPFPVGVHSHISESSGSDGSEDLALRYPELLGIQGAYKSRVGKKELDSSPAWSFSPPKTCVLLEPPDDESPDTIATNNDLHVNASVLNQQTNLIVSKKNDARSAQHQIEKSCNEGEPTGSSRIIVANTPMWKEPQSTLRTGKQAGENTLKRELWTKFEAASTYGFRLNTSAFGGTSQKGFLDMLEEVSCDGESQAADGCR